MHFLQRFLGFFCISLFLSMTVLADEVTYDPSPQVFADQETAASLRHYGQSLCHTPGFHCQVVSKGDTWYSLFPDFQQREEVMRLNRTNVALQYRNWIAVPNDFSTMSYMDMSPLPLHRDTHGKRLLVVNLALFAFGAYDKQGSLLYWGPVSSGAPKCEYVNGVCRTVTGKFRVFRAEGEDCTSGKYPLETHGGAPMPYCMYFHGGFALHGSTLSGFINRSSGCVRSE